MKHLVLTLCILAAAIFAGCFEVTEDIKNDQAGALLLDYSKYGSMQYSVGIYDISYRDYWGAFTYGDPYRYFGLLSTFGAITMLCEVQVSNSAPPGIYNETDKDSIFIITYDDDIDTAGFYELGTSTFTFTLEENGPSRVKGSFSGTLERTPAGIPATYELTNGEFDLPYRY